MHNITRDAAALINIKCCLSHFQVAQPHAVCRIKENIHLEVDFCEVVSVCVCRGEGFGTEGCLLMLQHLEGDVVALEACVVRQSSEAAPPPPSPLLPSSTPPRAESLLQREDGGISAQLGQCDDDETFYSKLIQRRVICQQAFPLRPAGRRRHPAVRRLLLKQ